MNKFFIHNVISDIKEVACTIFKAALVIGCMLAPFYLVHLVETCF